MKYSFDYQKYASREEMTEADRTLADRALEACGDAFAPHSGFRVGAAARLRSGRVMTGSNQESDVFPAGVCAERALLIHWQSRHSNDPIEALAIIAQPDCCASKAGASDTHASEGECYPCGLCRQTLVDTERRQGSPIRVIMCSRSTACVVESAHHLLPFTFQL